MSSVSIVIKAKSEAKAAFDSVKGDIKNFADDNQKAMSGMKAANDALSKAMSGDLVGAAQSAASAVKALWAVIRSNPLVALAAAAAAAAVAIVKMAYDSKMAAADMANLVAESNDYALSINEIEHGSRSEREAAKAQTMTLEELRAEYEKHIEMAGEKKRSALEASDSVLKASKEEREEAKKCADAKKQAYAEEMAIARRYEKAAVAKAAEIEKAYQAESDAAWDAASKKAEAEAEAARRIAASIEATRQKSYEEAQKIKDAYADVYDSVFPNEFSEGGIERAFDDYTRAAEDAADAVIAKEKEIGDEKKDQLKISGEEATLRQAAADALLKTEKEIRTEKQEALNAEAKARGAGWRQNDPWKNVVDPWDARGGKWKPGAEPIGNLPPQIPGGNKGAGAGAANDPWSPKLDAIKGAVEALRVDLTGGVVA